MVTDAVPGCCGVPLSKLTPHKEQLVDTHPSIKAGGEELVRSNGLELLARAGFAARGVVYVIIGILAIKLAFGACCATSRA